MPQMNLGAARVLNPVLTTIAQGYADPEFVGNALFRPVPVQISGGQILEFGKEGFMLYATQRSPGGATKRIQFGYLGKPFALENHAIECPVPREYMRDASIMPGVNLGTRALRLGMKVVSRSLEIQQATLAQDAAQYDAAHKVTLTGTSKWSDPASKPATDIETGKEAIRSTAGVYPNTLVISGPCFATLKNNPSITDRFKYTSKESITPEMLAALFDIDEVKVGKGVKSTDAGVMSDIWGNSAVLAYTPKNPSGMEEPSYGYTYTLEGHPLVEEAYYDKNTKSWVYGVGYERMPVLSGIVSGYLINTPV